LQSAAHLPRRAHRHGALRALPLGALRRHRPRAGRERRHAARPLGGHGALQRERECVQPAPRGAVRCADAAHARAAAAEARPLAPARLWVRRQLRHGRHGAPVRRGQPAHGVPGPRERRALRGHLHAAQAAQHGQYVGRLRGGRDPAAHGLDGVHGHAPRGALGRGGMGARGPPLRVAVPALQQSRAQSARRVRARRVQDDVRARPGLESEGQSALCAPPPAAVQRGAPARGQRGRRALLARPGRRRSGRKRGAHRDVRSCWAHRRALGVRPPLGAHQRRHDPRRVQVLAARHGSSRALVLLGQPRASAGHHATGHGVQARDVEWSGGGARDGHDAGACCCGGPNGRPGE
ncbi:hypothetical protein OC835_008085, partial [Tilletia horrida]